LSFVMRHGRRIEIIDRNEPDPKPKKRRKPFEPLFVQVPRHWVNGLGQSKSASTYQLALLILWEAFKQGICADLPGAGGGETGAGACHASEVRR